jgi:RNA polymerase sigma-70 factor (ECF subfamily)
VYVSEERLLGLLADDLEGSFALLMTEHQDAVFTAALRWSGNRQAAEDVVQDTFLRAYSALGRYPASRIRGLRPRPWLLTIALNVFRNELRSAGRRPVTRPLDDAELTIAIEGRAPDDVTGVLVLALPEEQRVPVVLRHVLGLGYEEVAEILARPVGTVKAQVSRGLRRLRSQLDEDERAEVRT